ncbi:MAG: nitrile hydratase accessory protein [Sneathiella sp.]|nr:MAG: nitrile hydratase accessory protein [Sneathiella sp.]
MTSAAYDLEQALDRVQIPRDEDGPVFDEPWQAQAFAMAVKLNEAGQFTWSEWADIFGVEIAAATEKGQGVGNEAYYLCWLAALEKIVGVKDLLTQEQLLHRREEWRQASLRTEHGQPIELQGGDK